MTTLAGLYPPITTAFDDQGRLALHKLEENLHRWIAAPLDGVLMPGSNSEAVALSREERSRVLQVCADTLRGSGKRLIAGTGVETTAEAIELTQEAAEVGAVASLVVPPTFYKSALTPSVLITHYHALAEASPIPLLVYNVPAFTGIDFAPATILAMAEHPRIIGMKDSSSNVIKVATVLAARPDFQVFAGTGGALLPFLSLGAIGGIMALANFAPEPLRALYDAFQEKRLADARAIQLSLVEINSAVTARFGVAGLKYAMDRSGYYGGPPRRPLLPLAPEGQAEIDRLLERLQHSPTS